MTTNSPPTAPKTDPSVGTAAEDTAYADEPGVLFYEGFWNCEEVGQVLDLLKSFVDKDGHDYPLDRTWLGQLLFDLLGELPPEELKDLVRRRDEARERVRQLDADISIDERLWSPELQEITRLALGRLLRPLTNVEGIQDMPVRQLRFLLAFGVGKTGFRECPGDMLHWLATASEEDVRGLMEKIMPQS